MFRISQLLALVIVGFTAEASLTAQSVAGEWQRLFKQCSQGKNDTIDEKQIIFLGPSNLIRVGDTLRRRVRAYDRLDPFSDLVPDEKTRASLWAPGPEFECAGERTTQWNLKVGVTFLKNLVGRIGGTMNLDKATMVTVGASAMAQDELVIGRFEDYLATIKRTDANYTALTRAQQKDTVIVYRGFKATGLTVSVNYPPAELEKIKKAIPAGTSVTVNASAVPPTESPSGAAKETAKADPKEGSPKQDGKQPPSGTSPPATASVEFTYQGVTKLVLTADPRIGVYYSAEYRRIDSKGTVGLLGSKIKLHPVDPAKLRP